MKTAIRNLLILLVIAITLAVIYWLIINYYDDKNRLTDIVRYNKKARQLCPAL